MSTYGLTTLLLIGVKENPNGYSTGYYCKDVQHDVELFNVAAGGGYNKRVIVSGDVVTLDFPNNVGQSRTFNVAIAGY